MGFALDVIFTLLAIRAIWKLLRGVMQGLSGPTSSPRQPRERSGAPMAGVHMEKDPVCGTYVVPDRAVSISAGNQKLFFCSEACRDKYRARTA
jgi:YHS domain-containing protein